MTEATTPQLLDQAFAHYSAGRLAEAEAIYRRILSQNPNQPDALHLLGVIAFSVGDVKTAIDLIGRAIAVKPGVPQFWSNLAGILNHQRQFDRAGTACAEALRLNPDYPDAYLHLGNALHGKDALDKAVAAFNEAIKFRPQFPEAYNAMGISLAKQGKLNDAMAAYRQAIEQQPNFADAHTNLGTALQTAGWLNEAIAAYQRAIEFQPTLPEAHSNLGNVLLLAGRPEQAVAACERAIELRPNDPGPYNNLGSALAALNRPDEATAAFLKSLAVHHLNPKAWNNLGNVQFGQGKFDEALASYESAARISPDDATADSNRIYALHFHPHYDADAILREQRAWEARRAKSLLPMIRSYGNDRTPYRKLRIGYVSPDFRQHVVGYNMLPVFENHDRSQFEIFCYSNVTQPDAMTATFQSLTDHWENIAGVPDEGVAQKIRGDQIDVLVDLALHMSGNRLLVFARKPAPIQVTFAGYPAGTGLTAIDYRLTDPNLDPPIAREKHYVEQSITLPESFWCYDPRDVQPAVNDQPAAVNGYITFGCLNNFSKVNDDVIALWAKVLLAVPNSRLLVMVPTGSARESFATKMAAAGVTRDRLEFVDRQSRQAYMEQYRRIDIGLDTFPYNGHTTSLDSLYMGVPVITLVGSTAVGRAGWSQLSTLGLTELAALDEKQFVTIATDLAGDQSRLADLRHTLRPRLVASPLMDAKGFTRNIEASFRQMWRAWAMA